MTSPKEPTPNPPRLRMSCRPDLEGCVKETLFTQDRLPTSFFRVKVEAEGEKSIKNCIAILTSIQKDGKAKWGGDTATLTFAPGEAPDRFSKIIRNKIPEFFDVLAVTSKGAMFPGTYDERYGRWWPYQPGLPEIFSEAGDYILAVAVSGDDVPTETALLRFSWTRDRQTSTLTLVPASSEEVAHQDTERCREVTNETMNEVSPRDTVDEERRHKQMMRWTKIGVLLAVLGILVPLFVTLCHTSSPPSTPASRDESASNSDGSTINPPFKSSESANPAPHTPSSAIVHIAPSKMISEVAAARPLQRSEVAKAFAGLSVDWRLYFIDGDDWGDRYFLKFSLSRHGDVIADGFVLKSAYPSLHLTEKGTPMHVRAIVDHVTDSVVVLDDINILQ